MENFQVMASLNLILKENEQFIKENSNIINLKDKEDCFLRMDHFMTEILCKAITEDLELFKILTQLEFSKVKLLAKMRRDKFSLLRQQSKDLF